MSCRKAFAERLMERELMMKSVSPLTVLFICDLLAYPYAEFKILNRDSLRSQAPLTAGKTDENVCGCVSDLCPMTLSLLIGSVPVVCQDGSCCLGLLWIQARIHLYSYRHVCSDSNLKHENISNLNS